MTTPTDAPTDERPTTERRTIREYARAHGLTDNAVRMRIRRGTLTATKHRGVVYVVETDAPPTDQETDQTTHATDAPTDETDRADLVAHLRSEVTFLRAELEARREAERELRVLLATRSLAAPHAPRSDDSVSGDTTPTQGESVRVRDVQQPWWAFWKR